MTKTHTEEDLQLEMEHFTRMSQGKELVVIPNPILKRFAKYVLDVRSMFDSYDDKSSERRRDKND